ncbi:MAG: hypothetical protein AMS24_03535 [Chlamydiae bacterium SM23_39]|nr:MAG: hypothetical protein AMS24_03535 [Chlamydiae bacterium SM23_39]
MVLVFLYHKIGKGKYSIPLKILEKQFLSFKKKYNIVIPGEKLKIFKLNICITFDDAYFDFYHLVFPLLKKYKIKAVLSIPTKYILEKSKKTIKERLVSSSFEKINKNAFCSWKEIKKMSDSGYVEIASHSYSHSNLITTNNIEKEILLSKKILEEKIKKNISIFIYPFGKFNKKIHKLTKKNYRYIMRIGNTFNIGWKNLNKITYRISSNDLKMKNFIFYLYRYIINIIRKR